MNESNSVIETESCNLTIEHLYTVEGYLTLTISVKSGGFTGKSSFCISDEQLENCIESLREVALKLSGELLIADNDSDAFISFEVTKLGHVIVSGQIGGSHQEHYMRFKFRSDQTILKSVAQQLGSFL